MSHRFNYIFFKKSLITALFFALFYQGTAFAGIRCGNDIISTGDTKTMVISKLKSCGEVLDKDTYIKETETQLDAKDSEKKIKSQKRIDLWSIRIREKGNNHYCYPVTFEDGILVEIGQWSRCN